MVEKLLSRATLLFLIGLFFCAAPYRAVAEDVSLSSSNSKGTASASDSSKNPPESTGTEPVKPAPQFTPTISEAETSGQEESTASSAPAPMFASQNSFERKSLFSTPSDQLADRLSRDKVFAHSDQSSTNLFEFFAKRTKIGYGTEFLYDSNVDLKDNQRKNDFKSTLDSVILFADPRGPLLYGFQYEVNAFRYLLRNANAVNHDMVTFVDLDPGGPTQYRMGYNIITDHSFVFGDEKIDVLRRNAKLVQTSRQEFIGRARHELNRSNLLALNSSYLKFDDHIVNDADTDRNTWKSSLDWERDLVPTWLLVNGISYEEVEVPGNESKNSNQYGGHVGVRHELTRYETLSATFSVHVNRVRGAKSATDPKLRAERLRELNPRTKLLLRYLDERTTSFSTGRTRFRSRSPAMSLLYQLTPRMDLSMDADYTWQRSRSSDMVAGSTERTLQTLYSVKPGIAFQVQEQLRVLLNYTYQRSRTRDYSDHKIYFDLEGSF